MPDSPTPATASTFLCDCDAGMRSVCAGLPLYKELQGKRYCVLHYPDAEKSQEFEAAFQQKLANKIFDFRGVWFPDDLSLNNFQFTAETNFSQAIFNRAVHFMEATFSGDTDFSEASFLGDADFRSAGFSASADFNTAKFSGRADFERATFSALVYFTASAFDAGVNFKAVTFNAAVDFRAAVFTSAADFSFATFTDTVQFPADVPAGHKTAFDFKFANIKSPESFSFPPGVLRPHWFININLRKFDLTNVEWESNPSEEVKSLERQRAEMPEGSSPSRLLSDLYRRLALSAEENHHYQDASLFRYGSMDARRKHGRAAARFWRADPLHWIYWATSGYGERVLRAFFWLIAIWLISAFLYTIVKFEPKAANVTHPESAATDESKSPKATNPESPKTEVRVENPPLPLRQALIYSVGVMTLQKPDPRPATGLGQTFVLLETVLGPVQAALLALAIRRKFMTV
ncbi:MAG TPA: pentapeptide repeat-containing protein [Pyrinomonadaceae bacterium]|nr:pentapeptide repeat-containing protein [Pyrinomonadaceae bacterium]